MKSKKPKKTREPTCPECKMAGFHKLDCTQDPTRVGTSLLVPTACPRCEEPTPGEILKCPACGERVCTDRCIAGRKVKCFKCEDAGW